MFGDSIDFIFLNILIFFTEEGCIQLVGDSRDIYNVTKYFYLKKKLFFWTFYLSKNPEKKSWKIKCITLSTKMFSTQLFSTLLIIRNVSWAANQYIIMISEGSCDTEDWSNNTENSALITEINYILTYIHIENSYFKL